MQMNLDSASVKDRLVVLGTRRCISLPLRPRNRRGGIPAFRALGVAREAVCRGDAWESAVWLVIGLSALVCLAMALGV